MDVQHILVGIAVLISASASGQYIRSILRGKTQPHLYTYLVWLITQSIGVAGAWIGGGGIGALPLTIGCFWLAAIFFLSIKYGTKNVTKSDGFFLAGSFAALGVWVFLENPLLAVLMASAIDTIGFIPTFRKAWEEPWSESVVSWALWSVGNVCSLLALSQVTLLTASYLTAILAGNAFMACLCLYRRAVLRP